MSTDNTVAVSMERLRAAEPTLHSRLVENIKARGADPEKVGSLHVDMSAEYDAKVWRDLQDYVRQEQQRLAQLRSQQQLADDEAAAYSFWQQKINEGLIVDSQKNRDAVIDYLLQRNQRPSVQTISEALVALHETLEKPEVLGILPNGEKQLPIDASESEMKRASVQQLRDLSARRFEGKSRPAGSFGGRF